MSLPNGARGTGAYANSMWQTGGVTADGQQAVGGWVPHDWGNIQGPGSGPGSPPGCGDWGIVGVAGSTEGCLPDKSSAPSAGGSSSGGDGAGGGGASSGPPSRPPSLGGLETMGGVRAGGADWASLAGAGQMGALPDTQGGPSGGAVMDINAPVDPATSTAMPPNIATGQTLAGPGADRQGLGKHIPPSIAALLKPKVY